MNKVTIYLNRNISGNVFDKDSILEAYATDRSILKIHPSLVALPENTQDLRKLLRFVNQLALKDYHLPIAVRGSGLDKTGADLTSGLVVSTEKMNKIFEIDTHDRLVHVQAGVTLGHLNSTLAHQGLVLPINIDPRETIGSIIANCPTDSYSAKYGGIANYIDRAEIILANGDCIQTSQLSKRALDKKKKLKTSEGAFYRNIEKFLDKNKSFISHLDSHQPLHSFGYPGISKIRRSKDRVFDILPAFLASEGTLGIISEVILHCEVLPHRPQRMLVSFNSFHTANEFLHFANTLHPLELNLYDLRILQAAESHGKKPAVITRKIEDGYIVYVSFNNQPYQSRKKITKCIEFLPKSANIIIENRKNSEAFNYIATSISSYLNDDAKGERIPLISDVYIPKANLSNFFIDLRLLEDKLKAPLPIFGSYAANNYSIRPDLHISDISGRRFALELLQEFGKLLDKHQGSIAGGSPEGRIKALITNKSLSPEEKSLYTEFKQIFDPNNILAPDIKFNANTRSTIHNLRTSYTPYIVI